MSEIFDNAIASITLGIEDFQTGTDKRMLSAARNYYAGLLLLAKECLIRAAPFADAMDVIGAKFKPRPDGAGGVIHEVQGYTTIDLHQLKCRFKDFGLPWPNAHINKLQKFRNDLEHFHLKEPASALGEAIALTFPMVVDFCAIVKEDPQIVLADVWGTILKQREAFDIVQKRCLASLEMVNWPTGMSRLDRMECPNCTSSLLGQLDPENTNPENVIGRCFNCGDEIEFEKFMEMVVTAEFDVNPYIRAKEGLLASIWDCPNCGASAYVEEGDVSICFVCSESIAEECVRCSEKINVHEYSPDYPNLCSYCAHIHDKIMRE